MADTYSAPFTIGSPVHFVINGDRYPGLVVAVSKTGHVIKVEQWQAYNFRTKGLQEGDLDCDFRRYDPPHAPQKFIRAKDGSYHRAGQSYCRLGHGMAYAQNPSF